MNRQRARYECCLWPGGKCTNRAIRAHSIQNAATLDALCVDGHVIMPDLRTTTIDEPPSTTFKSVGRNEASTFTGLCALHDQELFRPIEVGSFRLTRPEHKFLLAYRAVLKEAHAVRKSAILLQSSYLEGAKLGQWSRDEPSPSGMLAAEWMAKAWFVNEVQTEFDRTYLNKQWKRVEHRTLTLNVGPSVAVNSMFSTGLESRFGSAAAFVCLNVLPIETKTVAIFSFLREDKTPAEHAFGHIWKSTGRQRQYLMSKLILQKCSNFAISPKLFNTFSAEQVESCRAFFEQNILPPDVDRDDRRLFLFERVE
jgi:hypothetical protein